MKIGDKEYTTGDIKSRITQNQVKLDGNIINFQKFRELDFTRATELGDWMCINLSYDQLQSPSLKLFDVDDWATTNSPFLNNIFANKSILRLSKREVFVV